MSDKINYLKNELSNTNLFIHEECIEIWRIEERSRLKIKSIGDTENSTHKITIENEYFEKVLHSTYSRIEDVKDNILRHTEHTLVTMKSKALHTSVTIATKVMDNIIVSLQETLSNLEIHHEKKKFSNDQSKKNYELQLYIRMVLLQKEEEHLKNIPEIKSLKMAESELESLKLEYEKLSIIKKNITDKIDKTKDEKCKEQNEIIVKFAEVCVELSCINKRLNQHRTLLGKLETEYNDKFNRKNLLLLSQQKKSRKVSFWTHTHCPPDSIEKDTNHEVSIESQNLEVPNEDLKSNFNTSNPKNILCQSKLDSKHSVSIKQKKCVTFQMPSVDHNMQNTNNDYHLNTFENLNTKVMESNMHNDGILPNFNLTKNKPIMNMDSYESSTYVTTEPKNITINCNKTQISKSDHDFQSNKRKVVEDQSDFELKKRFNSSVDDINLNKNVTNLKPNQPSVTNENIHIECNLIENIRTLDTNSSINNHKTYKSDTNVLNTPKKSSLEIVNQNLKSSSNNKLFDDISQYQKCPPHEPNKVLPGSSWNYSGEQPSIESSFCDSEFAELFENGNNISQNSSLKSNFLNSFNGNYDMFGSLKVNNTPNETMARSSSIVMKPIRPHFVHLNIAK